VNNYQHSLDISADAATVYAALTTTEGLRGWWSQDCDVTHGIGGSLLFRFGANFKGMRVERLEPEREVRWLCTRAHIAASHVTRKDEWVGTHIIFRLTPVDSGRTRLDFEHIGLVPAMQCYDLCRDGWNYFLPSLQQFAETGCGTPFEVSAAVAA
jgi:uncharacterized protein YndB with AHSA1/START domain